MVMLSMINEYRDISGMYVVGHGHKDHDNDMNV